MLKQVVPILLLVVLAEAGRRTLPLPNDIDPKIVGGNEVAPNSIPFQVLLVTHLQDSFSICGGSLISTEWVLTAAHCFDRYNGSNVDIELGVHNRRVHEPSLVIEQPSRVVLHPNYDTLTIRNDIAVVQLRNAVVLNDNIQTIVLPRQSDTGKTFDRSTVTLSGWGMLAFNGARSDVLRSVELRVITNDLCQRLYNEILLNSQLCTSSSARRDACGGDSGGPLTLTEGGDTIQIGVVSYGTNCAVWPGVYSRVTSYLDWISTTTGIQIRP